MSRIRRALTVAAAALLLAWAAAPFVRAAGLPAAEGSLKPAKLHFLKGSLFEKRGAHADALLEYEKAFEFDKRSAFICRQAAKVALELGNMDAALSWVDKLRELAPDDAQTKVLTGRVHFAKGEMKEAEESFQEALKLDPRSADIILFLGSLVASHSPDQAKKLFERFIKENPEEAVEGHYQIGLLEARAGRVKEAEKRLRTALDLEPDSVVVLYSLAELYEVASDTDSAIAEYERILRFEPMNVGLINHIGELYQSMGAQDEARRRFESAKELSPSDPVSSLYLAMIWEREGDYVKAAEHLATSSALASDVWLNLRLSYFLTQSGNLPEAVKILEAAHERWPANDEIAYYLALGYDDMRRSEESVGLLRGILSRKPAYRDARYQLAVLLEKQDKIEEAEAEFRKLLSANPNDAGILNYLGYSLVDRGLKLEASLQLIERAVKIVPKNGAFQDSLGWAYFRLGRFDEAIRELEGASRKLPEDGTIWDHLGDAYAAAGRDEKAWDAWKRAQAMGTEKGDPGEKAGKLRSRFDPKVLGGFFLEHLARFHGGIAKYSGLCEIKLRLPGKTISHSGVLTAAGRRVELDVLGPLFTPILRVRSDDEGFTMDPLRIDGAHADRLMEEASKIFRAVGDYLSGEVFRTGPAIYGKSWFKQWVDLPERRLVLDSDALRVVRIEPKDDDGIQIVLEDFVVRGGRQVPSRWLLEGRGLRLTIEMKGLHVDFQGARL